MIKCPNCGKSYAPEDIRNPYADQGICDWCALGLMLADSGMKELPAMDVRTVILDENGYHDLGVTHHPARPLPVKPSEVN